MKSLKWWMRLVGSFYLLLFVIAVVFNLPPKLTLSGAGIPFDAGNFVHRFLVDTWVMFGLELGVVGAALWAASANPLQNKVLLWTVLGLELVRGIVDDIYMLVRGYDAVFYIGWIVIHLIIIVTGYLALRQAQQAGEARVASQGQRAAARGA